MKKKIPISINFELVKKILIHICQDKKTEFKTSTYDEKEILEAKSFLMEKWLSNGHRLSNDKRPVQVELSHPTLEARIIENLIQEDDSLWEKIVEMLKIDMKLSDILEALGVSDD